jgi:hypothetical protein
LTQELMRLAIRILMFKAITGFMGALAGAGGGGADMSTGPSGIPGGSDFSGADQQGGVESWRGKVPLLQGMQKGGISYNERLIRISEGQTPEAVIPLKGGKVPVSLTGGGGPMIHAPITIITPDAGGIHKSMGQIEAEVSSRLQRAAKRNT